MNTGGAWGINPNAANARSPQRSTGSANTATTPPDTDPSSGAAIGSGRPTGSGCVPARVSVSVSASPETVVGSSVSVSDSARRTLAPETATRSPIARSDRPCSHSTATVAVTAGVSLEARRGPLRCGTSALTPAADSACAHRQRFNGEVSNAAATCTWVAALIRINDTAANRRPAVSPASQAKDRLHKHPAAVLVLNHRGRGTDLGSAGRDQRQGRLGGHHRHRPTPKSARKNYRADTDTVSGVLDVGQEGVGNHCGCKRRWRT